eukprot:2538743-Pleurochrysis_carterae.AAC.6
MVVGLYAGITERAGWKSKAFAPSWLRHHLNIISHFLGLLGFRFGEHAMAIALAFDHQLSYRT